MDTPHAARRTAADGRKINLADAPAGAQGERLLACGQRLGMRIWVEERPVNGPLTTREHETVGFALKGRATLTLGDRRIELVPGDSWVVPAGVPHAYRIAQSFAAVEATAPPATGAAPAIVDSGATMSTAGDATAYGSTPSAQNFASAGGDAIGAARATAAEGYPGAAARSGGTSEHHGGTAELSGGTAERYEGTTGPYGGAGEQDLRTAERYGAASDPTLGATTPRDDLGERYATRDVAAADESAPGPSALRADAAEFARRNVHRHDLARRVHGTPADVFALLRSDGGPERWLPDVPAGRGYVRFVGEDRRLEWGAGDDSWQAWFDAHPIRGNVVELQASVTTAYDVGDPRAPSAGEVMTGIRALLDALVDAIERPAHR